MFEVAILKRTAVLKRTAILKPTAVEAILGPKLTIMTTKWDRIFFANNDGSMDSILDNCREKEYQN